MHHQIHLYIADIHESNIIQGIYDFGLNYTFNIDKLIIECNPTNKYVNHYVKICLYDDDEYIDTIPDINDRFIYNVIQCNTSGYYTFDSIYHVTSLLYQFIGYRMYSVHNQKYIVLYRRAYTTNLYSPITDLYTCHNKCDDNDHVNLSSTSRNDLVERCKLTSCIMNLTTCIDQINYTLNMPDHIDEYTSDDDEMDYDMNDQD